MSTKLNHSVSSITGFGYKQGVVPTQFDALLEKAQQNGKFSETITELCCQQKPIAAPEQVLVVKQPSTETEEGAPTMTTAAQTQSTDTRITAREWVEKNFDATPYIDGGIIPKETAWSFYEQAKNDGLEVGFSTITVAIYAKRNKLMEEKQKETIVPSPEHPADQKSPSLKNWLRDNFDFTPYLNGEKIPEDVAKDIHKKAQRDGLKVAFQSTVTDIYRLRRDLSKEKNSPRKSEVKQEIELPPPTSEEEMPLVAEKTALPAVEKTTETAPITTPITIAEMVAEVVTKQKQLRAKTEELLAEAARLEEEAKAEAEFEEFLKGVESLPNANTYLPKMLAHFQR